MFECKYKYELEDSIISAKYVYKSQKRKMDTVIAVLIPILMIAMITMLIIDIVGGQSVVWDVLLLVALAILEVMYTVIPITLKRSQTKAYLKQGLADMDYILIKIENNICTEALYKDDKEVTNAVHNLNSLTSYLEDDTRLVLIFNKVEFVCIRKAQLKGGLDKLKSKLNKYMAKDSKKRKK